MQISCMVLKIIQHKPFLWLNDTNLLSPRQQAALWQKPDAFASGIP
jgi:hypothetical protein